MVFARENLPIIYKYLLGSPWEARMISEEAKAFYLALGFDTSPLDPMCAIRLTSQV